MSHRRLWTPHTPLIQGTVAGTPWGRMRLASIPTVVLTPKILDSHSLHKDAPTGKHPLRNHSK